MLDFQELLSWKSIFHSQIQIKQLQSIEMKKIETEKPHLLKLFLTTLFLAPSKNPQFFDLLLLTTEALFFTLFISADIPHSDQTIRNHLKDFPSLVIIKNLLVLDLASILLIFILVNLLIRFICQKNLIKGIYLFAIIAAQINQQNSIGVDIAVWSVVSLSLLVEVLSTYECEFVSENFYSETTNSTKFFHYIAIVISVLIKIHEEQLFPEKWISQTIILVMFLILLFLKCWSRSKTLLHKEVLMRFYLLTVAFAASNIVTFYLQPISGIFRISFILISSQVLISIVLRKINNIQIGSIVGEKNKDKLCFRLLSYRFGVEPNKDYEEVIKQLIGQFPKDLTIPDVIDFKFENKDRKIYLLGEKILDLLQECKNFTTLFIKAQIRFHIMKQPIQVKKQINDIKRVIKQRTTCYNFPARLFQKLLIYKFQVKFETLIIDQYRVNQLVCFNELLENEKLRNMLVKTTLAYTCFWEKINSSVNKQEIVYKQILKDIEKILKKQQKIHQEFEKTKMVCKDLMIGYIEYIYMVERNVEKANKSSKDFWIFPELHNFLKLDEKLYICIGIDTDNFMEVIGIGYNAKKLLGYDKNEIKGQNVSIFVPEFYRQIHETVISTKIFSNEKQFLFNFHKETIIRHQAGFYLPMNVNLKVVYDPISGSISMEGFCKLSSEENYYDWPNFFFASSNSEILELGRFLSSEVSIQKDYQLMSSDIFDDFAPHRETVLTSSAGPHYFYSKEEENETSKRLKKKKFYKMGQAYIQYDLLLEIELRDNKSAQYYVAKNTNLDDDRPSSELLENDYEDRDSQSSQFIIEKQYQKYTLNFEDFQCNLSSYFSKIETIIKKINSERIKFAPLIIFIILLVMTGLQGFMISKFQKDKQNSYQYILDFEYIKNQTFGLDNGFIYGTQTYLQLMHNYSFDNSGVMERFVQISLMLQQSAQYLQKYNTEFYVPKYKDLSGISRIQNMPKPVKTIIKQAGAHPFFPLYLLEPSIVENNLKEMQILVNEIYSGIADSYAKNYLIYLAQSENFEQIQVVLCMIILIVLPYITAVILIKNIKFLNQQEYETIYSILKINTCSMFLSSAKNYLVRFVGGATWIPSKSFDENDLKSNDVVLIQKKTWMDSQRLSGNVSYRQNSVRNLVDEIISTNRETTNQERDQEIDQSDNKDDQKLVNNGKSIKKRVLFFIIFHVFMLSGNSAAFLSTVSLRKQSIFGYSSVYLSNILLKQAYFSQSIITFVSDVLGTAGEGLFKSCMDKYRQIQNEPDDKFFQLQLPSFSEFAEKLNELKYQNICKYTECPNDYFSSFNLIYDGVIQKMNSYMTNNHNIQEITSATLEFKSLIASHFVTQRVADGVLNSYIEAFRNNSQSLLDLAFLYNLVNLSMIAMTVILFVGGISGYWTWRKKNKIRRIMDLIPQDSFQESKNIIHNVRPEPNKISRIAKKSTLIIQNQ